MRMASSGMTISMTSKATPQEPWIAHGVDDVAERVCSPTASSEAKTRLPTRNFASSPEHVRI
jgi:hypothetical protein